MLCELNFKKNMKRNMAMLLFATIVSLGAYSQKENSVSAIQEALEMKNFVFKAESVLPQRGRSRQLTPEYDLTVRPDTLIAYLPFFGRAYSAPIGMNDGGIKFTSLAYNYDIRKRKKNGWDINISPKDASDVRQLYLTVFDNGRATLRVLSNNRDGITYDGYVKQGSPVSKKAF
jgi:hypothetical protein